MLAEGGERAAAPWDDSKLDWDKHVEETYYSYWEQYTYWAGQGWTVDESVSTEKPHGDAASAVRDGSSEIIPEGWRGEVEAPRDDVEVLNHLFGENCSLEIGCTGGVGGSEPPHDGGSNGEGPAASSQHTTPHQSGEGLILASLLLCLVKNFCFCFLTITALCVIVFFWGGSYLHVSDSTVTPVRQSERRTETTNREDEDEDDEPPEGRSAKVKRRLLF